MLLPLSTGTACEMCEGQLQYAKLLGSQLLTRGSATSTLFQVDSSSSPLDQLVEEKQQFGEHSLEIEKVKYNYKLRMES